VLPDRSASSGRNDRPQAIRSLGVATTSSPSCSIEETEGEMAMFKEVRCLQDTEVRHLLRRNGAGRSWPSRGVGR
jgi:hypothetical protein